MSQYGEKNRVTKQYLEEKETLETKYSDLCKTLYKEIGNAVAGRLNDEIKRIHKEGEDEKEEEGPKRDDNGDTNDAGGGEEREEAASLEDASVNDKIYGAIASRGTNTTNGNDEDD